MYFFDRTYELPQVFAQSLMRHSQFHEGIRQLFHRARSPIAAACGSASAWTLPNYSSLLANLRTCVCFNFVQPRMTSSLQGVRLCQSQKTRPKYQEVGAVDAREDVFFFRVQSCCYSVHVRLARAASVDIMLLNTVSFMLISSGKMIC